MKVPGARRPRFRSGSLLGRSPAAGTRPGSPGCREPAAAGRVMLRSPLYIFDRSIRSFEFKGENW